MTKWTEERRQKQAEAIKHWKPWEKSTGPKTPKGKAKASLNALKTGIHTEYLKQANELVRLNRAFLKVDRKMLVAELELICKRNGLLNHDFRR